MKTKITLVIIVLVGLWVLNKIRIVIFASTWTLFFWMAVVGFGIWFLSGGLARIPAIKRFIDRYDK